MARNAAAVLLLAVSIYAAAGATVGPLTTAVLQETDAAGAEEASSLLPVHRDSHEVEKEEDGGGVAGHICCDPPVRSTDRAGVSYGNNW